MTASREELDREPVALLFLGESAMIRSDYEAAEGYLERAAGLLPESSTTVIGLAHALMGRNATGRSVVIANDLRRVRELAESAMEQRRRWAGPSGEALAVLIRLQILTGAFRTALQMAIPASHGGEALDREAAWGQVAVFGAEAAVIVGDRARAAEFASMVPGTWAETLIEALSADPDAPVEDRIERWRAALAMPLPLQMQSIAWSRLAQLGMWPMPELDELAASGVIDPAARDTLIAFSEAARGLTAGFGRCALVALVLVAAGVCCRRVRPDVAHWLAMDMDMEDLTKRMIGLLTLVYNTRPKLEDPSGDEDSVFAEFNEALNALQEGFSIDYSLNFNLPPTTVAHVMQVLQEELPSQIKHDFQAILMVFSGIFIKLSYALEDRYPDIDIAGLLQEIGLDAAGEA